MALPDAATIIGIGVSLFGFGVALHLGVDGWIRLKRFEREQQRERPLAAKQAEADARLARIEQIVELTALEVERVAESQRFLARAAAEQRGAGGARVPERILTPH